MKYISLDIETTGLSLENDIIEVGLVLDDLHNPKPLKELPRIRVLFRHDRLTGQPYALGMHADSGLLKELQKTRTGTEENQVVRDDNSVLRIAPGQFLIQGPSDRRNLIDYDGDTYSQDIYNKGWDLIKKWLEEVCKVNTNLPIRIAGKNVLGFDCRHLQARGFTQKIPIDFRVLDVGTLFLPEHIQNNGRWLPSLVQCLKYSGIQKEIAHTAVEDALDVIECIRYKMG